LGGLDGDLLPGELLLKNGTPAMIWPLLPTDARVLRPTVGALAAAGVR
jgi:hypothetical protein